MSRFRAFSEMDQSKVGLVALFITALLLALSLRVGAIQSFLTDQSYQADFAESGGLMKGDEVRVAGVTVGKVDSVSLDHNKQVKVKFAASGIKLGDTSQAYIKSDNALGRKFLSLVPSGSGETHDIPRDRTDSGYSITTALGSLATTSSEIDVDQMAASIASLSQVLDRTPTEFRSALEGVGALSETISKRDQALTALFKRTASVSGVLAQRNQQIAAILRSGGLLFQELAARRQVINELFAHVSAASQELVGLVRDNKKSIGPALTQLRQVAALLHKYRGTLDYALTNLGTYSRGLGEAVGSGPFFQAFLQNMTAPTSLMPVLSDIVDGNSQK